MKYSKLFLALSIFYFLYGTAHILMNAFNVMVNSLPKVTTTFVLHFAFTAKVFVPFSVLYLGIAALVCYEDNKEE